MLNVHGQNGSPYLEREELAVASDDLVAFVIVPDYIHDEYLHSRVTKAQQNTRRCHDQQSHMHVRLHCSIANVRCAGTYIMFAGRLSFLVSSDNYVVDIGTLTGGHPSRHTSACYRYSRTEMLLQ